MSDKYQTPQEWAEKSRIAEWTLQKTELGDDGQAVDVWLYRAGHHGLYQHFTGQAAWEARQLHRLAKAMAGVKRAEEDLAEAKAELEAAANNQPTPEIA